MHICIYIHALTSSGQPLQSRMVKFGPDKMKSSTRFYFSILNACYLISFQLILLSKIMVGFFVCLFGFCLFVCFQFDLVCCVFFQMRMFSRVVHNFPCFCTEVTKQQAQQYQCFSNTIVLISSSLRISSLKEANAVAKSLGIPF